MLENGGHADGLRMLAWNFQLFSKFALEGTIRSSDGAMVRLRFILILLSTCLGLPAELSSGREWETGVVLLGNDRCLDGRVELVGDRYLIRKTQGNQVSIAQDQVQFVGNSWQEVYQFKARFLSRKSRPGDHYKLAKWCLSVQLLAEAGQHYLTLIQTHPPKTNPSVRKLGVEIKDAMLQQADFRRYLGLSPIVRSPSIGQPDVPTDGEVVSRQPESGVVTASAVALSGTSSGQSELDAQFNSRVQMILINRCGQANCHGHLATNPLRILEPANIPLAKGSRDNLASVIRYLSGSPAARTLLLDFATRPHGPQQSPGIGENEAHLVGELSHWIDQVASPVVPAHAVAPSGSPTLQPVLPDADSYRPVPAENDPRADQGRDSKGETSKAFTAIGFPVGADIPTAEELNELDDAITRELGFPPIQNSQDPFDPHEFNRLRAAAANSRAEGRQIPFADSEELTENLPVNF
jgi:hypothetical protein